jgi:DNA-binding MarR family transcriptional regulator
VERAGDPVDRRVSLISTSRRGAALLRRLRGRKNVYLARRLKGLEQDELHTLERAADILERLLEDDPR